MPRTRLRHFFLHSILFHIFLGVVITLALVYLFDKETGSGEGQVGGRLEPIVVSVIDESEVSEQASGKSSEAPVKDEEKENIREESLVLEKVPEITKEETIKKKPEVKPITAPKKTEKSEKKQAESVAEKSTVTESDSRALTESDMAEKNTDALGKESEKETSSVTTASDGGLWQ